VDRIIIQKNDFDLATELKLIKGNHTDIGAVVSFIGLVRDLDNEPIKKITLEYYPKMTKKTLESIVTKAREKWNLKNITIIHRIGDLAFNEQIVLVITTSKHRQTAFESCQFIMDFLKTKATFWKKEHTKNYSKWVSANDKDTIQQQKWDVSLKNN
jgi:molybdopterin synthase catalytic subunit